MPGKFQMGTEVILFEGKPRIQNIPSYSHTVVSPALNPVLALMCSPGFSVSTL